MSDPGSNIPAAVKHFANTLPKFPDGRIDYTHSPAAPVINCFVVYKGKILLLKRSDKVLAYKGMWNSIGGFLDELKPLREKVLEELREELGISESQVGSMHFSEPMEYHDASVGRTWIIHPVRCELKAEPKIQLDWEHTEYQWVTPAQIKSMPVIPGLDQVWGKVSLEKSQQAI